MSLSPTWSVIHVQRSACIISIYLHTFSQTDYTEVTSTPTREQFPLGSILITPLPTGSQAATLLTCPYSRSFAQNTLIYSRFSFHWIHWFSYLYHPFGIFQHSLIGSTICFILFVLFFTYLFFLIIIISSLEPGFYSSLHSPLHLV